VKGEILFFGERLNGHNLVSFRRKVGLLLQHPYLFHSSVLANVVWTLKIRGIRGTEAQRLAKKALERVGLAGFEGRNARTLSGGESQRVALARALVAAPDVLLLDEPTTHLDAESRRTIEQITMELHTQHGKTIIMATHRIREAIAIARRVLHLFQG